jgi:hypothetical protein
MFVCIYILEVHVYISILCYADIFFAARVLKKYMYIYIYTYIPYMCTIYRGLGRDLDDDELLSALKGAESVKRPEGKSFGFVEFSSHAAAKSIVEQSARRGMYILIRICVSI